ncbi:hypothetical protein H0H93_013293 [Arthromyces matolae]|nr:hypothetical protein H0H93_013293 [Arthromyces matolae]
MVAQRTKIQSWEEEMEKWNPSNLQKHDEAIASLKEQARHEGKDPNNVVDAYRLRKMNISHYRQLVKNLEPGSLVRGRPRTEIDPRIIAEWEAEMEKKKKKVWERYMNGKEKVERENEGDGGKAVVRYQNERYRVSQADARHRQKKKDWMKDVGGETNAPAPATHTLNEHHHHSEDEEEGDEGRRMSFSFQSDTD